MPELYSNQVKLNAASQPRASAPKMDDSLGRAMSNLAATADNIAGTIQHIQDVELNAKVQAKAKEALSYLEMADDPNGDYTAYAAKAKEIYSSAFEGASEGALVRFNRAHPDSDLLFDGASTELLFKKSNAQIFNRVSNDINGWASYVAQGRMSFEEIKNIVNNMPNLKSEQKDSLLNKAENDIDEYKISAGISQGTIGGIMYSRKVLQENKTMSPDRKAYYLGVLSNAADKLQTKEEKRKNDKDSLIVDTLVETYLRTKRMSGVDAANKYKQDIETLDGVISIGGMTLDTVDYNSPNYVSPVVLDKALKAMDSTHEYAADVVYSAKSRHNGEAILQYAKSAKDLKTKDSLLEWGVKARQFMSTPEYKELGQKEQNKIYETAYGFQDTVMDSVGSLDKAIHLRDTSGKTHTISFPSRIASPAKAIVNAVKNNNSDDLSVAINYGARRLKEDVLTGKLEQDRFSFSSEVTNAYVFLDAVIHDPEAAAMYGVSGLTHKALANAYETKLHSMLMDGSYNAETSVSDDVLKDLIVTAMGDNYRPTEEQKTNLIKPSTAVHSSDFEIVDVPYQTGEAQNIMFPRARGKKTGFID